MSSCRSCGKEIPPDAAYCPHCGAAVAPSKIELETASTQPPAVLTRVRPPAVTVSAVIFWVFGSLSFLGGLYISIVALIIGALEIIAGWGLWTLQRWSRSLTMVVAAYYLFSAVLSLAFYETVVDLISAGIILAVYGLILWFMFRPEVKEAFAR